MLFIKIGCIAVRCRRGYTLSQSQKSNRKEYIKSAAAIGVIVIVVLGFFVGLSFALNAEVPVRVVESGSMCVPYDAFCDGWSHAFSPTLHIGDIILIEGVKPEDINANYPNSDIIVYQNPTNPTATPIVHRVVAKYQVDGVWYFQTKGDGNGTPYPETVSSSEYDSNTLWHTGQGVPQNLVLGKVVMRIPYFGHITLFLRNNSWGLPLIIALIAILLLIEFIVPFIKKGQAKKKVAAGSGGEPTVQQFTLLSG
jgi:signal peptidase I